MKFFKNYFHIKKCSSHQFRASKLCPRCINALNLSKNPPLRIFVLHFISLIRFEKNFNCFLIAVIVIVGVALDQVEINEDIFFLEIISLFFFVIIEVQSWTELWWLSLEEWDERERGWKLLSRARDCLTVIPGIFRLIIFFLSLLILRTSRDSFA